MLGCSKVPVIINNATPMSKFGMASLSRRQPPETLRYKDRTIIRSPSRTVSGVPDLKLNLISVPHLDREGFVSIFENGTGCISQDGRVALCADLVSGLYRRFIVSTCTHQFAHSVSDAHILHNRLGHFANRKIRRLGPLVNGIDPQALSALPIKIRCDT